MSVPRGEIASKIREGAQRRGEEVQRLRQLRQERREEMEEMKLNATQGDSSGFIPYIIISLIFISFPLSEPNVDWLLVSLFFLLNGVWTLFFHSSYWLNWLTMIFSNVALVRWSPVIPELPRIVSQLPIQSVGAYIGGNIVFGMSLYFLYVDQRGPWRGSTEQRGKKPKPSGKGGKAKKETLNEFVKRRDREHRLDLAASGMVVGNVALLLVLGVVPLEVFVQGFRQILSFIR